MFQGKEFPIPEIGNNFAEGAVESYDSFLSELLPVEGFKQHKLKDSFGGRAIYGFSMGDLDNKPTFIVDGSIHKSHEWRTSFWIMHFMEVLNNPMLYPEMASEIQKLKSRYSFYFIPVVAPDTFQSSTQGVYSYGNDNGIDIAQNFDYTWPTTREPKGAFPFSEPEAQNIRDVILEYKPILYINCHTHGGHDGFMMRRPVEEGYMILYKDFFESYKISTKDTPDTMFSPMNGNASAYGWASQLNSSHGVKILSNVFEVGDLQSSLWQSRMGVTGLLLRFMYGDNFATKNTLTLL